MPDYRIRESLFALLPTAHRLDLGEVPQNGPRQSIISVSRCFQVHCAGLRSGFVLPYI